MSVFLGVIDAKVNGDEHDISTSKIGGKTVGWQNLITPVCEVCGKTLALVVQIYCPLSGSPYHRSLFVFACTRQQCCQIGKSWVVYRCQKIDPMFKGCTVNSSNHVTMATDEWCDDADDWGSPANITCETKTVASDTFTLKDGKTLLNQTTDSALGIADLHIDEPAASTSKSPLTRSDGADLFNKHPRTTSCKENQFDAFYISVFEESDLVDSHLEHERKLLVEYCQREGINPQSLKDGDYDDSETGGCEKYEKTAIGHGDQTLYKFLKKLSFCPEQIIRYQWNGVPMLMEDKPCPPNCSCGAERVFEFQLMPALVNLLHGADDAVLEFGTLIVYTCAKSCWKDSDEFAVEWACVQNDTESPSSKK